MDLIPYSLSPNPFFARESSLSLNGPWEFSLDKQESFPASYPSKIQVPFAVETPMSGIFRMISKSDCLHYRKALELPDDFYISSLILHFEAVDQICDVYLNRKIIAHHEGGYWPFSVFIEHISKGDVLEVRVKDDTDSKVYAKGKQSNKPGGVWYRPTSGIWGDVWIEKVPSRGRFLSLDIKPVYEDKKVSFKIPVSSQVGPTEAKVMFKGQMVGTATLSPQGEGSVDLSSSFHPWSPEHPDLYEVEFDNGEDRVMSYFGFRKISIIEKDGMRFFALNDKPLLLNALLDQGYYSQSSGLTPLSEESTLNDLNFVKEAGFNCLRKHIKIEPRHWYYLCDKLGIIVIQDIVSGGEPYGVMKDFVFPFVGINLAKGKDKESIGRKDPLSKAVFEKDLLATIRLLSPITCIVAYTLFNEAWGQFDAKRLTKLLYDVDGRKHLIDSTSGWYDVGAGDFSSHHIYFRPIHLRSDKKRILSLSEFGGFSLPIPGHIYAKKTFGYKTIKSRRKLFEIISKTYLKRLVPLIRGKGLNVIVYTELSDVEEETNGLLTYDRAIIKVPVCYLAPMNAKLYEAFEERFSGK